MKVYFITRAKARMEGTMNTNRSVRVKDIVEKFQMEVINKGTDYDTEILTITDVNRPASSSSAFSIILTREDCRSSARVR